MSSATDTPSEAQKLLDESRKALAEQDRLAREAEVLAEAGVRDAKAGIEAAKAGDDAAKKAAREALEKAEADLTTAKKSAEKAKSSMKKAVGVGKDELFDHLTTSKGRVKATDFTLTEEAFNDRVQGIKERLSEYYVKVDPDTKKKNVFRKNGEGLFEHEPLLKQNERIRERIEDYKSKGAGWESAITDAEKELETNLRELRREARGSFGSMNKAAEQAEKLKKALADQQSKDIRELHEKFKDARSDIRDKLLDAREDKNAELIKTLEKEKDALEHNIGVGERNITTFYDKEVRAADTIVEVARERMADFEKATGLKGADILGEHAAILGKSAASTSNLSKAEEITDKAAAKSENIISHIFSGIGANLTGKNHGFGVAKAVGGLAIIFDGAGRIKQAFFPPSAPGGEAQPADLTQGAVGVLEVLGGGMIAGHNAGHGL